MTSGSDNGDLDLLDYVRALRRRWPWVVVSLVLLPLVALWYSSSRPVVYEATARVLLAGSAAQDVVDERFENANVRSRDLANQINLAESDRAATAVRERLGLTPTDPLPDGSIDAKSDSDVLEFTFRGDTPEAAAAAANAWADVFVALNEQEVLGSITEAVDRLRSQIDELRAERDALTADLRVLEQRLAAAPTEEARADLQAQVSREAGAISGELNLLDVQIEANIQGVTQLQLANDLSSGETAWVFQTAVAPTAPIGRSLLRNLTMAVVLGGILGAALALVRDQLDQSITDPEDVEKLGFAVLGAVPNVGRSERRDLEAAGLLAAPSKVSDAYQKVRSALQFVAIGNEARCILVTSPNAGEGKTTTAVSLALAFSGVDRRVVLVDADFRRPRIHAVFGTDLVPGVSDALVNDLPLQRIAVATSPAERASLAALPAGTEPPNPTAFLASPLYADFIDQIASESYISVVDAPPILPVADATS
ncbi:MAG: Wzz/FepE/Etk N-terminal domain-containing protein, partial [Actinomycetota bacterium]